MRDLHKRSTPVANSRGGAKGGVFCALVCLPLLAGSFPIRAQEGLSAEERRLFEEEFELLADEETVLAAAKHRQHIGQSPATVIVITARDIEASGAATLVDVLRAYPAVYILLVNPSHAMLHIRGSYRVLLLLDGRELNPELFPAPFYESLPVGVHDIERIEIVLGPNSALYGANAVAAVVAPSPPAGRARGSGPTPPWRPGKTEPWFFRVAPAGAAVLGRCRPWGGWSGKTA